MSKRTWSVEERFWAKVDKTDGCWEWRGAITGVGYGALYVDGKMRGAHRISYVMHIGSIPEGFDVDHLCRVRHCVNPAHLEAVTRSENLRRGAAVQRWGMQVPRSHCLRGHPLEDGNLRFGTSSDGRAYRMCKTCRNDRQRERRALVTRSALEGLRSVNSNVRSLTVGD